MTSGGARNRSGPQPDPNSLTSARRGLALATLPREGYAGEPPAFPLPEVSDRELELWQTAWSYPQAAAWAVEPWRWQAVAMWVRTSVVCESREATAADRGSLHRFADQIGMTPAGLKENGWSISKDEVQAKRASSSSAPAARRTSTRDRLTVVDAAAGS